MKLGTQSIFISGAISVRGFVLKTNTRAPRLPELLQQSMAVKRLVESCVNDLSTVNSRIAQELEKLEVLPGVETALNRNLEIEDNVQEASERIAVVTTGLEDQVRDRSMVDRQLAAALEQEEAARHVALHDVLTDLPNRALFDDRLDHGLAQAKRHGWALAIMFIDLDSFKGINDLYGHKIGDRVLQETARRIKHSIRADDTASRYGGDEFLYLLTEIRDEANVAGVAEKIIDAIRAPSEPVDGVDALPSISGSIGIALFPKDGDSADELIRKADAAMYVAKRTKVGYAFSGQGLGPEPAKVLPMEVS